MKIAKKVKKTYRKASKAIGLNCIERHKVAKAISNGVYDTAVNTATAICIDTIYGVAGVVMSAGSTVTGIVKNKISGIKKNAISAEVTVDFNDDEEESEE